MFWNSVGIGMSTTLPVLRVTIVVLMMAWAGSSVVATGMVALTS